MSRAVGIRAMPSPPLITPGCRIATPAFRRAGSVAPATGVSPFAAGDMLAFPFVIEDPTTIYKAFWVNGSAASNNNEVAVYDEAFLKLVSTGSVAAAVVSVPQAADLTDTILAPGLYYAGLATDVNTTNRFARYTVATTGNALWQALGCWKQAGLTLGSLPSSATPADCTNVGFPLFGLITRSAFDL